MLDEETGDRIKDRPAKKRKVDDLRGRRKESEGERKRVRGRCRQDGKEEEDKPVGCGQVAGKAGRKRVTLQLLDGGCSWYEGKGMFI